MINYRLLIICLVIFANGCSGLGEKNVIGRYFLTELDFVDSELNLSYKLDNGDYIGVVEPKIEAIGYDKSFIIVRQRPKGEDKMKCSFYIIPLKFELSSSPDDNKYGPLSEDEYLDLRLELNISPDIKLEDINGI